MLLWGLKCASALSAFTQLEKETHGQPSGDVCSISSQHNQVRRTPGLQNLQIAGQPLHCIPEGLMGGIRSGLIIGFLLWVECGRTNRGALIRILLVPEKGKQKEIWGERGEPSAGRDTDRKWRRDLTWQRWMWEASIYVLFTNTSTWIQTERGGVSVISLSLREEARNDNALQTFLPMMMLISYF